MNKIYFHSKKVVLIFAFVFSAFAAFADGSIRGFVKDAKSGAPLDNVQVVAKLNGVYKGDVYTDDKGFYDIKSLPAGVYSLTFLGSDDYNDLILEGIKVNDDQVTNQGATGLGKKIATQVGKEIVVERVKNKPIRAGEIGTHISSQSAINQKATSLNRLVGTTAGVYTKNGGTPSFLGSRANQTGYFINGVKVIGSIPLIPDALNDVSVITGGVPAQYGDFTGGAINLSFKSPTMAFVNLFDYSNSMPFDRYNFQQLQGYFSGPLKIINKQDPGKERVVLGYTLGFSAVHARDANPSAIQLYKVKDEKLAELEANPNAKSPSGDGLVPSASYVNSSDFEKINYRQNAAGTNLSYISTLTIQPAKNINVQIGLNGGYSQGANYSFTSSLFNYKNPSESQNMTNRFSASLTHKLKSGGDKKDEKDKSIVTDALYTVRMDYTNVTASNYDPRHRDNTWEYGYVGDFTAYKAPSFRPVDHGLNGVPKTFVDQNGKTVTLRNYIEQVGYVDTALGFQRSDINPISANYTQQVFDEYGRLVRNANVLQALGGLMNGDGANSVYSMWTNVGAYPTGYSKSRSDQFTLFAIGEASLAPVNDRSKKHDIQFGLSYEQRAQRGYSMGAASLWGRATALANQAVLELDQSNPRLAYDANGIFQDTVYYERLFNKNDETVFAKNLRDAQIAAGAKDVYGNPITQNSWIDVNTMKPEDMKLSWFSPDDLYNNGNQLMDVYGYDYLGNVIKGRPSIKDWNENPNRPIGAFAPINAAAWIQDQFSYKEIKFRLGLRAEQFDANIKVLKDPYLLFPAKTAAEWGNQKQIPSTVASDATIYVDNYKSASPNILGFRSGSIWYNKEGNVLTDPSVLAQAGGRIQPLLTNPALDLSKYKLDAEAFQDYSPTPIFMPRIWFSFPISDDAEFFANYDVLSQRPAEGFFATNDDYQFFERRALDGTLANPNLRPSKKTSYEVGYKQKLTEASAISFIASYAETRDLIQLKRFYQAFPTSYTAFGNEDFSTSKAFRIEYFLYAFKHMDIVANYSLLFADGTGSSASTSAGLVAVNKPSLKTLQPLDVDFRHTFKLGVDYRFKTDADHPYDGPVMKIKGKERNVLQDFGMNFQLQGFSGAPYTSTANKNVSQIIGGSVSRNPIKGTINGQRLPGQVYCDFTIDKTFMLKYTKKDIKKETPLNIYIVCNNLFNTLNVLGVYSNTGLATDDGYLTSADGIRATQNQINRQAFVDQYQIRLNSPGLYALPRQARLGVRIIFNSRKDL